MSAPTEAALAFVRRWPLCPACSGTGLRYQPVRRAVWMCPHCEGWPHPALGPATIRVHGLPASAARHGDRT